AGEVRLHRLLRDEDLGGDRLVRQAGRREGGDPQLGRAELLWRPADDDPGQLRFRSPLPCLRTEAPEDRGPFPQRPPRLPLALQTAQDLPLDEQRPRALERQRAALVLRTCALERGRRLPELPPRSE